MQEAKRVQRLKVSFLCTGNSCRSQMAEGWVRYLKGDVIDPHSASVERHGLNPMAVRVMAEAGVDISGHHSKHLEELQELDVDYVITGCGHANDTCPVFPGKAKIFAGRFLFCSIIRNWAGLHTTCARF